MHAKARIDEGWTTEALPKIGFARDGSNVVSYAWFKFVDAAASNEEFEK